MRKLLGVLCLLLTFNIFAEEYVLQDNISINQSNINSDKKQSTITLTIKNTKQLFNIYIFASTNSVDIKKYTYPLNVSDMEYFPVGGGLANDSKNLLLSLNNLGKFNVFHIEERDIENDSIKLKFDGLADPNNELLRKKLVNFIVFVDCNNDKFVTQNEIAKVSININNATSTENSKIRNYRFSSGNAIGPFSKLTQTRYIYFHLTSVSDAEKYKRFIISTFGDLPYLYNLEMKSNYSTNNCHILLAPMSNNLGLYQPYNFNNDNRLIFEIVNEDYNDGYYIPIRAVEIKKTIDVFHAYIDDHGELSSLQETFLK
jgi:hypothetical protein